MGKEETGFATFLPPQKLRTSLSTFLTAFPCLEGDWGLAETRGAVEITTQHPGPNPKRNRSYCR